MLDPRAIFLAPLVLAILLSSSILLGRLPPAARSTPVESVTMLVASPEPLTLPDWRPRQNRSEARQTPLPETERPLDAAPASKLADATPTSGSSPASPMTNDLAHDLPPDRAAADPTRDLLSTRIPESLSGLPLSQLIEDQAGLAAGLAALPATERLSLPRISIRVNAEWLEALPLTQERLYFSITPPQPDHEVLAYLPKTYSFDLERPERPLWQIHDGEQVPELAELRSEAARWLGVPPELVGLYTWHPPVFEDALRMFVLDQLQRSGVRLGPRDVVTVRLAPGAGGTLMNIEPIRQKPSIN